MCTQSSYVKVCVAKTQQLSGLCGVSLFFPPPFASKNAFVAFVAFCSFSRVTRPKRIEFFFGVQNASQNKRQERKKKKKRMFATHAHSVLRISQPSNAAAAATTTVNATGRRATSMTTSAAASATFYSGSFSRRQHQKHKNRNQSKTATTSFIRHTIHKRRDSIVSKAIEVEDEDDNDGAEAVEGEEEEKADDDSSALKESQFTSYFAQLLENSDNDVDMLAKFQTEVMALEKSVKDMEAQVQGEQDQKAAIQDQYLRSVADFQNFQKRTAKEKADLAPAVKSKMVEAMLPVLDNFDLTAKNVKGENEGEEKIIKGYQLLHKQLIETLEAEGLKVVPGEGEPFDPNVHEAIMREESEDVAEDHIMEEFRKGYLVGEKLVRASMVKVSSGKP